MQSKETSTDEYPNDIHPGDTSLLLNKETTFFEAELKDYTLRINKPPSSSYKISFLRTLFSLPASMSGIPFSTISYEFGRKISPIIGFLFAGSIIISAGSLSIWGAKSAFDTIFLKNSSAQNKKTLSGQLLNYSANLLILTLAIGTLIPSVYIGYTYNNKNIAWPLITLIADSGVRIYSFNTLIKMEITKIKNLWKERSSNDLKIWREKFENINHAREEYFIKSKEAIECADLRNAEFKAVINQLYESSSIVLENRNSTLNKIFSYCATLVVIFPLMSWALNCIISFSASGLLTNNIYLKILFVLYATFLQAYFELKITYNSTQIFLNNILMTRTSFIKEHYPKVRYLSFTSTFIIVALSFATLAKVIGDQSSGILAYIFYATVVPGNFILTNFSLNDLFCEMIEGYAKKSSNEHRKKLETRDFFKNISGALYKIDKRKREIIEQNIYGTGLSKLLDDKEGKPITIATSCSI